MMNYVQVRSIKNHCHFLEWSCHGIVLLVAVIAFTYMWEDNSLNEMEVNLFMALIVDILIVAVTKGEFGL